MTDQVPDDVRRLVTEEQRQRFYAAKRDGAHCGACGKALRSDETVYIERFAVGTRLFYNPNKPGAVVYAMGPVGAECVPLRSRAELQGQEPERCEGCGRGIYYRTRRRSRQRVVCSERCTYRVRDTKRPKAED